MCLKHNQFQRWSGYVNMSNFRPFPPWVQQRMSKKKHILPVQGVQPWALTKFPDFSLTFPWPFCGFPWPWDILSAFHYCLNTNFASNLTNHSPKVAIRKKYLLGRLSKYKIWCFKLSQDCAQWQPSELNTLEGQTVLWFFIIFYYLDCTTCKFPDFSLTFANIHFLPDLQQNSLNFPWLLPSLEFPWLFPDRWTPCCYFQSTTWKITYINFRNPTKFLPSCSVFIFQLGEGNCK